jgi:hypothetical protein
MSRPKGSKNRLKPTVIVDAEPNPPQRALSIRKFALAYDISDAKVYAEIRAGRLQATKLGDRTLILAEHEEEWRHSLARRATAAKRRGVSDDDGGAS